MAFRTLSVEEFSDMLAAKTPTPGGGAVAAVTASHAAALGAMVLEFTLGKPKFAACTGCHGAEGKGNAALGAPNLTDRVWLYGGSLATVSETIAKGRSNRMPAFGELLGPGKVQVLAAYVWSLSHTPRDAAASPPRP